MRSEVGFGKFGDVSLLMAAKHSSATLKIPKWFAVHRSYLVAFECGCKSDGSPLLSFDIVTQDSASLGRATGKTSPTSVTAILVMLAICAVCAQFDAGGAEWGVPL